MFLVVSMDANMDYAEQEPTPPLMTAHMVAGEWYLRGFADAYNAGAALVPDGPAGEQYSRGYSQGLAIVQRDFFAAIGLAAVQLERAEV